MRGFKKAPIYDVRVFNCAFEHIAQSDVLEHVEGLVLRSVKINGMSAS